MNKYVERLYNGVIKENPTFVLDARYVSDTGSYIIRHQRTGYGTFYIGCTCFFKPFDFTFP